MYATRWFEDITVGDRFETPGYTFTEGEILDFAFRYDPQPFHLDREFAEKQSIYGGLIASGFHTLAVCFRLVHMSGFLVPVTRRVKDGQAALPERYSS
jgi:acyl dehydratase